MKYTIVQFRKDFPDDDACLDYIFKMRFAKMPYCPQCHQETTFKRITGRRCYQCSDKDCQYQLYPTAGTVFEKTRTSLNNWFYAIYLMTSTRNGVAAKELQRQLGVTYKCAWRLGHQIRKLMDKGGSVLSGIVEADEVYIGGAHKNKHKKEREKLNEKGTGAINKTPVLTMLQRGGEIVNVVLDKAEKSTIAPEIAKNIQAGATLVTDGFGGYAGLQEQYKREVVNHEKDEFVKGIFHTNTVEGYFSHFKRMIKGTHIHVSKKYMKRYLDEHSFRYVHRKEGQAMFHRIIWRVVA